MARKSRNTYDRLPESKKDWLAEFVQNRAVRLCSRALTRDEAGLMARKLIGGKTVEEVACAPLKFCTKLPR
jgi:hypothetical protein